jgi:hypothetical protein
MMSTILVAASESVEEAEAINPFVIGGVALGILVTLLLILLAFGKGREHT